MEIGYFSSKFPYPLNVPNYMCGGSILATQSFVKEISKMGYDIKVFTTSHNSKSHSETHRNIKIFRYGTNLNLMSSNISIGLFHGPLKHNVDIAHISFDIPPGPFAGLRYAKKKGLPLVVTYHGDWDGNYGNLIRKIGISFSNRLIDKLLSYADIIISPSNSYVNYSKHLKKYENKIVKISNGINFKEFEINYSKEECRNMLNLPLDKHIILFFGYLSPNKNPDLLLKVLPLVLSENNNVLLIFAGNGSMMSYLQNLSKKLNIENYVKFAGFVGKDKRSLYYGASDIFCLPSKIAECYPLSILESMASNIPVIASNIGGIPDMISNNYNGILVKENSIKELSNALINLLDDEQVQKKLSKNALKNISNYSWENIAKETAEVYMDIIN